MNEPSWMTLARRFDGIGEVKGPHHNPAILDFLDAADGRTGDGKTLQGIRDDETPWCATFVSAVLELDGIESARSAWARSYLKWGETIDGGVGVGAIAVLERGPQSGHVAFVAGRDRNGNVMLLGGNQSDRVKISAFDTRRVIGWRWPKGRPFPTPAGFMNLPLLEGDGRISKNEA